MDYAITVKKTRNPITQQHYLDYLDKLSDSGKISNVYFETTRGLHCHFMLTTEEPLDYKKTLYPTKRGWNAKAVRVYRRDGWIRYCRKDYEKNTALNTPVMETHEEFDSLMAQEAKNTELTTAKLKRPLWCCNDNKIEVNSPKL